MHAASVFCHLLDAMQWFSENKKPLSYVSHRLHCTNSTGNIYWVVLTSVSVSFSRLSTFSDLLYFFPKERTVTVGGDMIALHGSKVSQFKYGRHVSMLSFLH